MGSPKRKMRSGEEAPLFLTLETATPSCGLALMKGNEAVYSLSFIPGGGHSTGLMPAVEAMVWLTGVPRSAWRAVVISRGPGSFTGLRIGLATAKAISLGLSIPLYGVPTLEALAFRLSGWPTEFICPLLDARKSQVFVALYRQTGKGLKTALPPRAAYPEELPRIVPPEALFTGDGADRYGVKMENLYGANLRFAPPDLRITDPAAVGMLGLPKVLRAAPSELARLIPEYVRASDAEINHGNKPSRRP